MITKEDVGKELVGFYKKYKDHMDVTIYYDVKEKKLVSVIDRDESYLRSGAECECIVTYEKNWVNNSQLELSEFLDPEEMVQFDLFMEKKYNQKHTTEFVADIDDTKEFLGEKKFYERLEEFFEYYLEDNEIYDE